MPAAKKDPDTRDYPVKDHFRRKERNKAGIDVSVSYDPDGDDGWPGAKAVFVGVPGSDEVEDLLAHGLLFPIPDEEPSSPTSSKES